MEPLRNLLQFQLMHAGMHSAGGNLKVAVIQLWWHNTDGLQWEQSGYQSCLLHYGEQVLFWKV